MIKPLVVLSGPVDTFSGYGARARDIATAILKSDKYELKIIGQRWGNTPFGFLKDDNPVHIRIKNAIMHDMQLPKKPDVWIQVTVPNEFQAVGAFNIGITAGIETTLCDASWIDGCNRMNLVLTSSNHAKKVFESTSFTQQDQAGGKRSIKLQTNIDVLFEGIDTNIYQPKVDEFTEVSDILDDIAEPFCFLFVGHWLQGEIGEDRKDVGMLIKTFLEQFKNRKNAPALVLKTSGANFSTLDKNVILDKINSIRKSVKGTLPNIYLIHGELTDEEMNELYNHNKIRAMVSFTKGEGFGRPLLEFSTAQKPILVSNYSGHLDFLKQVVLIEGKLTKVHPTAVVPNMILAESEWFTVNYNEAAAKMEQVFRSYGKFLDSARRQSYISKTEFSLDQMAKKIDSILDKNTVVQVPFQLPKLTKIG